MLGLLFIIAVLIGFIFHFFGTFPVSGYCARIAWGSWLIAAAIIYFANCTSGRASLAKWTGGHSGPFTSGSWARASRL